MDCGHSRIAIALNPNCHAIPWFGRGAASRLDALLWRSVRLVVKVAPCSLPGDSDEPI